MTISSRTPEGMPEQCPICGNVATVEPSLPGGDGCCPSCGHLLWLIRDAAGLDELLLTTSIADLKADSIAFVEFAMNLEEIGVIIPDDAAEQIDTVEDLIRYLRRRQNE